MRATAVARAAPRKLAGRVWSTRPALVVAVDTGAAEHVPLVDGLSVAVRPSAELVEIGASLAVAEGADYLYLRGLEHMRTSDPGDAHVAVAGDGAIAASLFVHDAATRDRLELYAPGIYPPIAVDEAVTEGVYCWPSWRGRGVTPALLSATVARLGRLGIRRALAVIDADNTASLRAFSRVGYLPTGTLRVGRYRLNRWSSSFVERARLADDLWSEALGRPRANVPSRL